MGKGYRPDIQDGLRPVKMERGRIIAVDPVKHICSVVSEMDNRFYDGVQVMSAYLTARGTGSFVMPEENTIVLLGWLSTDRTPIIMGFVSVPNELDQGDEEEGSDPNDHRLNRPVLNKGDRMVASSEAGFIIMRKGGLIEIGANQATRSFYIPISNIVQHFCENWILDSVGGKIEIRCRREDESHGVGRTPVEFRMRIREFCETVPEIDIGLGRILEEDGELSSLPGGLDSEIVARFKINERFAIWIDKLGNVGSKHFGTTTESYVGPRRIYHHTSKYEEVRDDYVAFITKRYSNIRQTDTTVIGRDKDEKVFGNVIQNVEGEVRQTVLGNVTETYGDHKSTVTGSRVGEVTANIEDHAGGGRAYGTGTNYRHDIGGAVEITVGGTVPPNPLGIAYSLNVSAGVLQIFDKLGNMVFASGGVDILAPSAKVVIRKSGSVEIVCGPIGTVRAEFNLTGIQIRTPAGEISMDNAGTVLLGPGPVRGNVVTTLSHPVDFMTGAPISGASQVQAGGAPLPGPASFPSLFLPDLVP